MTLTTPITSEQLVLYYTVIYYFIIYFYITNMADGLRTVHLDLFTSTKVNTMLQKYSINNNDSALFACL